MIKFIIDTEFDSDGAKSVRDNPKSQLLQIGLLKYETDTMEVLDSKVINVKPQYPVSKHAQEFLGINENGYEHDAKDIKEALEIFESFIETSDDDYSYINEYGKQDGQMLMMEYDRLFRSLPKWCFVDVREDILPAFCIDLKFIQHWVQSRDYVAQAEVYEWLVGEAPSNVHTALGDCCSLLEILKQMKGKSVFSVKLHSPEKIQFWLSKILEGECFMRANFNKGNFSSIFISEVEDSIDNLYVLNGTGIYFNFVTIPFYDKRGNTKHKIGISLYIKDDKGNLVTIKECTIVDNNFERVYHKENEELWSKYLVNIDVINN